MAAVNSFRNSTKTSSPRPEKTRRSSKPSNSLQAKNWTIFWQATRRVDSMLDDMFSFIDPIIELNEDSLSEFITQMETFLNELEEKGEMPSKIKRPLTEETY